MYVYWNYDSISLSPYNTATSRNYLSVFSLSLVLEMSERWEMHE